jgi:hypothetical protein
MRKHTGTCTLHARRPTRTPAHTHGCTCTRTQTGTYTRRSNMLTSWTEMRRVGPANIVSYTLSVTSVESRLSKPTSMILILNTKLVSAEVDKPSSEGCHANTSTAVHWPLEVRTGDHERITTHTTAQKQSIWDVLMVELQVDMNPKRYSHYGGVRCPQNLNS